jgi:hypothetical protein
MEVSGDLAFDEGGIACRSRFCPVRQYNKDKPNKFRVDMFLMACSKSYFIMHADVYQRKNSCNVGIHPSIRSLPTTQNAVLNSAIALGLHHKKNHGARYVSLDNRYQCPELAYTLREKFQVLSTGTCRQNCKGWNRDLFDLKKTDGRGTFMRAYDKNNHVAEIQWVDSRVVNFVTTDTNNNWSIGEVKRQVGSKKMVVKCPNAIRRYQQTMFGVDKGDQLRARSGGFANKAHFKKWYKTIHLGLMDIMLVNGFVLFNMYMQIKTERAGRYFQKLQHHEILMYVAEYLLSYNEQSQNPPTPEAVRNRRSKAESDSRKHKPVVINNALNKNKKRCTVCRTESYMAPKSVGDAGLKTNLVRCTECYVTAHNYVPEDSSCIIDGLAQFEGLTYFEILHSRDGQCLWERTGNPDKPFKVNKKNEIYKKLRTYHGLSEKITRKRKKRTDDSADADTSDEDDNIDNND